jgi:hypothetical protein
MRSRSARAKRTSAVIIAAQLGRRIRQEHPEVADMYRRLISFAKIIQRLRLIEDHGVSEHIARNAVVYALQGYQWGCGAESYEGLIADPDELRRIISGYRRKTGRELRRQKKGIFGLTAEERSEVARKAAQASGWTVYTKRERECALRLCADSRFCYTSGRLEGKPKLELVAKELNRRFHQGRPVRDRYSVNFVRGRAKRQRPSA